MEERGGRRRVLPLYTRRGRYIKKSRRMWAGGGVRLTCSTLFEAQVTVAARHGVGFTVPGHGLSASLPWLQSPETCPGLAFCARDHTAIGLVTK